MQLTINRSDLRPEYVNTNCSQTKFNHFSDEAQQAMLVTGRAVFWESDGRNYNTVYPPKKDNKPLQSRKFNHNEHLPNKLR